MGLTNCAANFGSFIGPLVVKYIVTEPVGRQLKKKFSLSIYFFQEDEILWRIVFMISAGLYIASALFFVAFGSGEKQIWNETKDESKGELLYYKYPTSSKFCSFQQLTMDLLVTGMNQN